MKTALQLYSVRDDYEKDPAATLEIVKRIGFDGVELYGAALIPAASLRAMIEAQGLEIVGYHVGWNALAEDFDAMIEYNRMLGNKKIIIPNMGSDDDTCSSEAYGRSAEKLSGMFRRVTAAGFDMGFHSHSTEHAVFADGGKGWDIIGGGTDKEMIMQLDTGNCLKAGDDPVAALEKWGSRARTIHYKPYSDKNGYEDTIGSDGIDWEQVYKLTVSSGVCECIILEYEILDGFTGVEKNFKALKKLMNK